MRVKLTLQQADQVEWALDPMNDFWTTEDGAHGRDGEIYPVHAMPHLEPLTGPRGVSKTAKILILSRVEEINEDLLYRLEEQLPDMARQAGAQWKGSDGSISSAMNAASRIRHRLSQGYGE